VVPLTVLDGTAPLVLVAPHGGRRDPRRRPWTAGGLRMNDLHTASLTAELAARTGAAAVINATHDRNDVDLNRIGDAHDAAPGFLDALAARVEAAVARHGRATVLTVHGWNVVQPGVDVGVGARAGGDPFAVGPGAAVSPAFAATTLRRLVATCAAHGIAATVGARYPARHRENLVQLFTPRHAADPRPRVARLAALAPRVDAVQLELAIPLRWPGPWRERFSAALCAALDGDAGDVLALPPPGGDAARSQRLELVTASGLAALVAVDPGGARLLVFPPEGGLLLFTGERTGHDPAHRTGPLEVRPDADGGLAVRFAGPLLRFPDTRPFLDLEAGLARATLVHGELALDVVPRHAAPAAAEFAAARGGLLGDGVRRALDGDAFLDGGGAEAPWPRVRAALRLDAERRLALTVGLDGCGARGFLCAGGRHDAVVDARATLAGGEAPLARVALEATLASGRRVHAVASAVVALPVVRGRGPRPVRLELAACRVGGDDAPAGWCEVGGL
jgi:hypothetical protein